MARRARAATPAPGKEQFAALVLAQCAALGLRDAAGLPDRYALSARCGLAPTTLHLAIARPTAVSMKTLLALEAATGVPLARWLEALGRATSAQPWADDLSPAERRLLAFARRRGDAWIMRTVDWLESDDGAGTPS